MTQKKKKTSAKKKVQKPNLLLILSLFCGIFAFALYINTLGHGWVYDDASAIHENFLVKRGSKAIPDIFTTHYRYGYWAAGATLYRPLSLAMFAIEWEISPANPPIHHFINILIYAITGSALFLTLARLLVNYNLMIPLLCSLFFIAHPIHTEVVANIKSRDELLSFLFVILTINSLWAFLKNKNNLYLLVSLVFYFLAFLSKEGCVTMLAIFPLLIYYFKKDIKLVAYSAFYILPFLLYVFLRFRFVGDVTSINDVNFMDNVLRLATEGIDYYCTAFAILGKYLQLLLFSWPLSSDYSFNSIPIVGPLSPGFLISFCIYAAMGIYVLKNIMKKDLFVLGILLFLIPLSIYSNLFIMIGSSLGERFLYVPALGFCLIVTLFILKFMGDDDGNLTPNSKKRKAKNFQDLFSKNRKVWALSGILLLLMSGRTISRNFDWKDEATLFERDVKYAPESAKLQFLYGMTLLQDKAKAAKEKDKQNAFYDEAIACFEKACEINPSYADAYERLGMAWYKKGDNKKAIENYELATKYNPGHAKAWSNSGIIYFNAQNLKKAEEVYTMAVKADPRFPDALRNLGSVYAMQNKHHEALKTYLQAIEYEPNNGILYYYVGISYESIGKHEEAKIYFEKSYSIHEKYKKMHEQYKQRQKALKNQK